MKPVFILLTLAEFSPAAVEVNIYSINSLYARSDGNTTVYITGHSSGNIVVQETVQQIKQLIQNA